MQAPELLDRKEQKARHPQDRAQKVLQVVPGFDSAQGSEEVKNAPLGAFSDELFSATICPQGALS